MTDTKDIPTMVGFGARLFWARQKAGFTQQSFGDLTGYTQRQISDMESGMRDSPSKIENLADALQVTTAWLMFGIEEIERPSKRKPITNLEQILKIATAAFDINAAYCRSVGDFSFTSWEDAPDWQKETIIDGVMFHLDYPDATPSARHENWLEKKEIDGWSFGAAEDAEKKEHNYMIPFQDLPKDEQIKGYIFDQIVRSVAEATV